MPDGGGSMALSDVFCNSFMCLVVLRRLNLGSRCLSQDIFRLVFRKVEYPLAEEKSLMSANNRHKRLVHTL
jgi:hypothetical protein